MSPKELRVLKDEWAKRLGLSGWSISVGFTSDPKKTDHGCALNEWSTKTMDSTILLLRQKYRPKVQKIGTVDYEVDLVHELLHLVFEAIDNTRAGSPKNNEFEKVIEHQAKVLVRLKRENHGREEKDRP